MSRFTDALSLQLLEHPNGDPVLTVDGRVEWEVREPLVYDVGAEGSGVTITVPAGSTTDLASIPRPCWTILPPDGPWTKAAVLHDNLYRRMGDVIRTGHPAPYTRAEADNLLREAMQVVGVAGWKRQVIWAAVRVGGGSGWGS